MGKHMQDAMDDEPKAMGRFVPAVVVTGALVGFIALAWYAYHAGTQSIGDGDLMVVEADKTPIKEKPTDPGGMQFPNQDKTIFDTFSNKPQTPPKVERVLPTPEEPMQVQQDPQDTTSTWVNDSLHKDADKAAPEQVIAAPAKNPERPVDMAPSAPAMQTETYVAPAMQPAAKAAPVEAQTIGDAPVATVAKPVKEEKPVAAKPAAKPVATGGAQVQLGAYHSQAEAMGAWKNIQQKFPALADKSPNVVKADLGEKGIYYRLRTGGFAGAAQAKAFCATLSAKGQACILPTAP